MTDAHRKWIYVKTSDPIPTGDLGKTWHHVYYAQDGSGHRLTVASTSEKPADETKFEDY